MTGRPVRVLLFSTLYPSSVRPGHGVFVETRLRELLAEYGSSLQAKVLAPVPWFPSTDARHGDRAAMARTPHREQRNGLDVLHPRYAVIPRVGMTLAPFALALSALRAVRRLQAEGFDCDLIDAHYFYPDGVAAAWVSRVLGKPLVITARGSDINLISQYTLPRRMMLWAARRADACVGVSQALVDSMRRMGVAPEKLHVWRNGVDPKRFQPWARARARQFIGHDGSPLLLSVGNLVALKGHDLCIDALAELKRSHPDARLLIAGSGPLADELVSQAQARGVADSVHLVGQIPNAQLAPWYSAADCLLLASSREGWPNVLLESMACGTPVVASAVGGVPEVVAAPEAGRVLGARTAEAIAATVRELLAAGPESPQVRRYAERFGWADTSKLQHLMFTSLVRHGTESHA